MDATSPETCLVQTLSSELRSLRRENEILWKILYRNQLYDDAKNLISRACMKPGDALDSDVEKPGDIVKEGIVHKRGKNFGVWKERYMAITRGGALRMFDKCGGRVLSEVPLNSSVTVFKAREGLDDRESNQTIILESSSWGKKFLRFATKEGRYLVHHLFGFIINCRAGFLALRDREIDCLNPS